MCKCMDRRLEMLTLDKNCSTMIKGIAVLLMILHHLWGFPERVPELHLPSACVQIGSAGKICVSMFMFLSGYGLYANYLKQGRTHIWKRVWNVYKRYWQVFLVFVPIGYIMGMHFNWLEAISNLTCLSCSYNHEWWFLATYVELLLVFALTMKFAGKRYFTPLAVASMIVFRIISGYVFGGGKSTSSHITIRRLC